MRPCRLYAELTMLVLREYRTPAIGFSTNLHFASARMVSSTTGATRSMNVITHAPRIIGITI